MAKLASRRRIAILGKNAMYIFLFHYPVCLYVTAIFNYYDLDFGWATGLIEMAIYLPGSFLLSYLAWYLFEGRKSEIGNRKRRTKN